MANKRIIKGVDTPTRIQLAWDEIVAHGQYPSVIAFAKKAQIAPVTFYQKYSEWAARVRNRRDQKRGTKKRSIATMPKPLVTELRHAEHQIQALQKELLKLEKQLNKANKELETLRPIKEQSKEMQKQHERFLGAFDYLYGEFKKHGVTGEKIAKFRNSVEKHIFPVMNENTVE